MHVRLCPECGEEYRPEIATCAECGAALEDQYDDEGEAATGARAAEAARVGAPGAGQEAPAPAEGPPQVILSSDAAADLEPLARALGAARVAFHVRAAAQSFDLLVAESDLARAEAALRPLLGDPTHAQPPARFDQCPACGSPLTSGAAACAECGLSLGAEDVPTCPRCRAPLDAEATACASCGYWRG